MKRLMILFFASILLFACNNDSKTNSNSKNGINNNSGDCVYSFAEDDIKFEWTAFKTTSKLAVKGTFEDIRFDNIHSGNSIQDIITESTFEVNLNTIFSGNEERDVKLQEFFVGNLVNVEQIFGNIIQCEGSNNEGDIVALINFNNVELEIPLTYSVEEEILNIKGTIDILEFKAKKSLDALHEKCFELHKGEDGVSKTWSEVDILILAPIKTDCK